MNDPVAAVVDFLKSDASVLAATEGRVWGGEIPRRETPNMPQATVTVQPAGGGFIGLSTLAAGDVRMDVDCYADTPLAAWSLYLLVYQALKGMERGLHEGCLLHWATPSSRGNMGRDPDTDWPMAVSTWQILVGE